MTQIELAEKVNCDQGHLSRIIRGEKSAGKDLALKLGKATGTDALLWLYGSTKEKQAAVKNAGNGKAKK